MRKRSIMSRYQTQEGFFNLYDDDNKEQVTRGTKGYGEERRLQY